MYFLKPHFLRFVPSPSDFLLCFQLAHLYLPLAAAVFTALSSLVLEWVSEHGGSVLPRGKGLGKGFSLPSDRESLEQTGRVSSITFSDFVIAEGEWSNPMEMPVQGLSLLKTQLWYFGGR